MGVPRDCLLPVHPVILAAGRGSRLGSVTADKPKLFVSIGERTIYERQVDVLEQFFDELTVVLGHGFEDADAETIDETLDVDADVAVDHVVLDDWESVDNAASLHAAIRDRQSRGAVDDLLVVCGDVVFAEEALRQVLDEFRSEYREHDYNAVGCFPGVQDEMTAVRYDESGTITEYGAITGHQEVGLFVLHEQYVERAAQALEDNLQEWFPVVFEEFPTKRVLVPEWAQHEINTSEHLEAARDGLPFGEEAPAPGHR